MCIRDRYKLPTLPTPGEAYAKLEKRLAQRVAQPAVKPTKVSASAYAEQTAWTAAGLHCSANERRADEASRDVEAWLKCKYMREHLGEEFAGTVTAATTFGIFVTLDSMYVEGLVHVTELGGEYFRFDEARQELRGERTGMRYAIGSRVQVQVSRVDLDGRKIDFRLVQDPALAALDGGGRKSKSGRGQRSGDRGARPAPESAPEEVPAAANDGFEAPPSSQPSQPSRKRAGRKSASARSGNANHANHAAHAPEAVQPTLASPAPRQRNPGAEMSPIDALRMAAKKAVSKLKPRNKDKARKPRR